MRDLKLVRNTITRRRLIVVCGFTIRYHDGQFVLVDTQLKVCKFGKLKDAIQYAYLLDHERKLGL
jgi:hypothetical protein